ncbi:hypothetical protein NOI87_33450, partial [Neorhizobium galegae]|uniref:hypothetical protein n=1 Tax=Neorhizobium galegae TaxID=399 RepID=UPI0021067E45
MFHRLPVDPLVCNAFDLRKRFLQAAPLINQHSDRAHTADIRRISGWSGSTCGQVRPVVDANVL